MKYIQTIGMEVHAQLATKSKLFCTCSAEFGEEPNTNTCPVCMGMPGVLPTLNREAVRLAVKAARALNCTVNEMSGFARKNYFYPDLPKGYQITQYKYPIAENGYIELDSGRRIRIRRLHIEEDTGKMIHEQDNDTLVDFNRSGVGLIEIVTEPDIESSEEAVEYLFKLRQIIRYCRVSHANMEMGQLRCEPNISLREKESDELGIKTEIKNLNSFKSVQKGIEKEAERQAAILDSSGTVISETLLFNEKAQDVMPMRKKETAGDYRYFQEPDLPDLIVSTEYIEEKAKSLPELPAVKHERFMQQYKLRNEDVKTLIAERETADYFEECIIDITDIRKIANFFIKEIPAIMNKENIGIDEMGISPRHMNALFKLIETDRLNLNAAQTVLAEMHLTSADAESVMREKGLEQTGNEEEIEKMADSVIMDNNKEVERYMKGEKQLFGFLVGQIMKESRGRANPKTVNEILRKKLEQEAK